jgi:membrane associated rhomboid family serine protease
MKDISKLRTAIFFPAIFVILLWIIKIVEESLFMDFHQWGVYPLRLEGLKGIIFSPLIHGSYEHLISNTFPLLILGWALFYFYKELGLRITLMAWLMSGIWVWVFARESWHIGASGIIYSWAAFLFVSGVIRQHPRLMALSLLVAFLYGSMVWGIFPLRERVSWEGHLMGLLAGLVLALFFRETGPQRKIYSWELEEEDNTDISDNPPPYWMNLPGKNSSSMADEKKLTNQSSTENSETRINYIYTTLKPKNQTNDSSNPQKDMPD